MALPPNIATPTLVTGRADDTKWLMSTKNNTAVKDGAAQNSISSVSLVQLILYLVMKGVFKVLENDRSTKDMGQLCS